MTVNVIHSQVATNSFYKC